MKLSFFFLVSCLLAARVFGSLNLASLNSTTIITTATGGNFYYQETLVPLESVCISQHDTGTDKLQNITIYGDEN